jgi:hypothetical protein
MNDLRTLLEQTVGEPPRDIDVAEVYRRARRQRLGQAAVVTGVLAPLVAAAITVPLLLTSRSHPLTPVRQPTPPASTTCQGSMMSVRIVSSGGAAGTMRWVISATNRGTNACTSRGYPGMDFHASTGWLGTHVHRGGYPDINVAPRPVHLAPGRSLSFIVYWSDVVSTAGPCRTFDRIEVTMPDTYTSAVVPAAGCVNPSAVRVGPVS